jgi:hypothetical protein
MSHLLFDFDDSEFSIREGNNDLYVGDGEIELYNEDYQEEAYPSDFALLDSEIRPLIYGSGLRMSDYERATMWVSCYGALRNLPP